MLMLLALTALARDARDVVHEGPPASSPESFYILGGPHACRVAVVVESDGRPLAAQAKGCSRVLAPALEDAAMGWRWEREPVRSTEVVEVPIRPPSFTPKAGRRSCLLGFEIDGTDPAPLTAESPPRCDVQTTPVPQVSLGSRLTPAWCAVDIVADAEGVRSVQVDRCSDGFEDDALDAVAGWHFEAPREQTWRILLGWLPDHG